MKKTFVLDTSVILYDPQSLFEKLAKWWLSKILAGLDPVDNDATREWMRFEGRLLCDDMHPYACYATKSVGEIEGVRRTPSHWIGWKAGCHQDDVEALYVARRLHKSVRLPHLNMRRSKFRLHYSLCDAMPMRPNAGGQPRAQRVGCSAWLGS